MSRIRPVSRTSAVVNRLLVSLVLGPTTLIIPGTGLRLPLPEQQVM
jgi:hypothetical protein